MLGCLKPPDGDTGDHSDIGAKRRRQPLRSDEALYFLRFDATTLARGTGSLRFVRLRGLGVGRSTRSRRRHAGAEDLASQQVRLNDAEFDVLNCWVFMHALLCEFIETLEAPSELVEARSKRPPMSRCTNGLEAGEDAIAILAGSNLAFDTVAVDMRLPASRKDDVSHCCQYPPARYEGVNARLRVVSNRCSANRGVKHVEHLGSYSLEKTIHPLPVSVKDPLSCNGEPQCALATH